MASEDWIFIAITNRMVEVSHHPYGLCVLKKCISTVPGAKKIGFSRLK